MTDALRVLSDDWVLFRGYANRRGEVDHLLIGHRGVWAIEVKARPVCVHVDGDRWSYEKFDRYGNRVDEGSLEDRRGRSWGRQVSDIAGDLEAFLRSRGQDVDVRTAVVILHDRATLGAVRGLEIDLVCAGAGYLLERLGDEAPVLDSPRCSAVARLVRRDHAFHAQRRRQRRGARS
ncbi:MAG: NERD domain-containing protein, partial [Actinomycetota bacterium]|nr:NERD domain-containing protein [Actinomycetota bacterium]